MADKANSNACHILFKTTNIVYYELTTQTTARANEKKIIQNKSIVVVFFLNVECLYAKSITHSKSSFRPKHRRFSRRSHTQTLFFCTSPKKNNKEQKHCTINMNMICNTTQQYNNNHNILYFQVEEVRWGTQKKNYNEKKRRSS